jgi:hypothetical protein
MQSSNFNVKRSAPLKNTIPSLADVFEDLERCSSLHLESVLKAMTGGGGADSSESFKGCGKLSN